MFVTFTIEAIHKVFTWKGMNISEFISIYDDWSYKNPSEIYTIKIEIYLNNELITNLNTCILTNSCKLNIHKYLIFTHNINHTQWNAPIVQFLNFYNLERGCWITNDKCPVNVYKTFNDYNVVSFHGYVKHQPNCVISNCDLIECKVELVESESEIVFETQTKSSRYQAFQICSHTFDWYENIHDQIIMNPIMIKNINLPTITTRTMLIESFINHCGLKHANAIDYDLRFYNKKECWTIDDEHYFVKYFGRSNNKNQILKKDHFTTYLVCPKEISSWEFSNIVKLPTSLSNIVYLYCDFS